MRSQLRRTCAALALALVTTVAGCGDDDGAPSDAGAADAGPIDLTPEGCNPIAATWSCMLPYPSDVFRVADATYPSGHRVEVPEPAQVHDYRERPLDFVSFRRPDGFSHLPQILARFPTGVDASVLVFHDEDVSTTLSAASPTQLIAADSGERVVHFAELDPRPDDDTQRTLIIRPMTRLANGTRYVVAIQGLVDTTGAPIAPPEGFRKVRDGDTADDDVLAALAARYEVDVFPVLEAAGVARSSLQLAWDFTTVTEEHTTRDMLAMRDDLIAKLSVTPPAVTITSMEDPESPEIARLVKGTIRVPLYVDSPSRGARLVYDGSGRVVAQGEADVPFTAVVPRSVAMRAPGSPPARLMQYGHGFFGEQTEIESPWFAITADRLGLVAVAVDWWGMSRDDLNAVLTDLGDNPPNALAFTDRLHQGMANQIALAYAALGPLATAPEMQVDASPLYDTSTVYYYGNSNGHLLGGTYVALSPHVERAVLGVGGASYAFILFRSGNFSPFLGILETFIPDPVALQAVGSQLASQFDRIDPITYAPHLLGDTYAGSPATRRVLLQIGVGDAQVPNLAAHLQARTLGIPQLAPSVREIAFVPAMPSPIDGSALVEFDFGIADPLPGTYAEPAAMMNEVHDGVRQLDAAIEQIDRFLRPDGRVEATCDGVCDPE